MTKVISKWKNDNPSTECQYTLFRDEAHQQYITVAVYLGEVGNVWIDTDEETALKFFMRISCE